MEAGPCSSVLPVSMVLSYRYSYRFGRSSWEARGGGGGGAPAHHSSRKGMWSMYCSPRTGAAQLTALSQQACLVMSGPFWQAGVRSPGCWEPCGQVLSRPPLGEAGTKPREGPGMASPFVPSAPEILFAWLCRKKELKKKEKEKS